MNYKAAADFLALGVKTVQFCTIVMKEGYGIINDLESWTSFLMQQRGIGEVARLIFVTHAAREADLRATVEDLRGSDVVHRVGSVIRVLGGDA